MSVPAWKPRHSPATVLVVLALHLVVLAGALRLGVWPERTPSEHRPPLAVQLIWQRLTAPAPPPKTPPQAEAPALRPPRTARPVQPSQPAMLPAPAVTDPALQAITQPTATPGEPATPPSAAVGPAPALNLALPRGASAPWRQRAQAVDDPRSNTPKLTLEQKLAMAMGGEGEWVEEVIDADHRRLRRGNTCVYLQRPAAAQLDPFHQANRHLPWQFGTPTTCR